MSNAHKIIKNFTSDKFSPELKEKLWKWLVDSSEQAEKDEALMELWEDQNFKADASTERSYQNFRRKIAPRQRKATARYTLRRWLQVAAVLLFPLLSIYNRMKSIQNLSSTMCPEANKNRLPCPMAPQHTSTQELYWYIRKSSPGISVRYI